MLKTAFERVPVTAGKGQTPTLPLVSPGSSELDVLMLKDLKTLFNPKTSLTIVLAYLWYTHTHTHTHTYIYIYIYIYIILFNPVNPE